MLTAMSRQRPLQRLFPEPPARGGGATESSPSSGATATAPRLSGLLVPVATILFACAACAAGAALEARVSQPGSGILATSLICLGSTALASRAVAPGARRPVQAGLTSLQGPSMVLGCVFLGSLGASARLNQLAAAGPAAALACAAVLVVHLAVALLGARLANVLGWSRIGLRHLLIASNANVGGSGTALAMASAMGWEDLAAPAAACGSIGYAVATALGVWLHGLLVRS